MTVAAAILSREPEKFYFAVLYWIISIPLNLLDLDVFCLGRTRLGGVRNRVSNRYVP